MADELFYFGPGTTPRKVAEAVERAKEERREAAPRRAATTAERERFFQRLAETMKQTGE